MIICMSFIYQEQKEAVIAYDLMMKMEEYIARL